MHISPSTFLLTTLTALLPTAAVLAEELRAADVPSACTTICGPMVQLTNTCDIDPNESAEHRRLRLRDLGARADNDGDNGASEPDEEIEAQCICSNKSFDVASVAALCADCIAQNGQTTEDMDKIMSQCSFPSASYAPSATTIVAGIAVEATKPTVTSTSTSTGKSGGSVTRGSVGVLSAVLALAVAFAGLP